MKTAKEISFGLVMSFCFSHTASFFFFFRTHIIMGSYESGPIYVFIFFCYSLKVDNIHLNTAKCQIKLKQST